MDLFGVSGLRRIQPWLLAALLLPATALAQQPDASRPVLKPALPNITALPNPLATPTQAPLPPQPQAPPAQVQVGAGAQIRTGSVLGQANSSTDLPRIETLLQDHQYIALEALLNTPNAESSLTQPELDLFRGVLNARQNNLATSIRLLQPLADSLGTPGQTAVAPAYVKFLRRTLAEDYLRLGDLHKAAAGYAALASQTTLTPEEQDTLELPLKLLPLVADNPPMTVEYGNPFSIPYDRDPLGLMEVPVFVDAQSHDWMFDPTAPFNLICRSSAHLIGLKISDDAVTVHGITGRPIHVQATLIPRLTLGEVTFRNVTAFVFDDADYFYPHSQYQIRGVLGYPAISALGSLRVTQSGSIEVQPGERGERLISGAHFFLDGDQILVALGKPGDERTFQVDASGQQTYLTSRYLSEHPDDFAGQKMKLLSVPGSASKPAAPAYTADKVHLLVGNTPLTLRDIQVLADPLGNAAIDPTYGLLGMDILDGLKSYTFDYRTMLFAIETEAPPDTP
jgi:predicted aspartyl protease